jgi:hypothetical protein
VANNGGKNLKIFQIFLANAYIPTNKIKVNPPKGGFFDASGIFRNQKADF